MLQIKTVSNWPRLLTLWVLSIVLGWSIIIYPGLSLRNEIITSWGMLPSITLKMLLVALVLGGVIGALQYLFLRFDIIINPIQWVLISVLSYGVGTAIAFLVASIGIGIIYPQVFSSGGAVSMPLPLAFTMITGGFLIGLIQAYTLRNSFSSKKTQWVLLWVLGTSLSWGIGFFLMSYGAGINLPLFAQSGLAGLAVGLGTALLFRLMGFDLHG